MSQQVLKVEMRDRKIRAGVLLKRSRYLREWRERWVVLTYNYLVTFKHQTSKEITEVIDLRRSQALKSYLSTQEDMMPGCFKLYTGGEGDFCFCARDTFEKWSWMVAIERLMNYHTNLSTNAVSPDKYISEHGFPSLMEYSGADKHIKDNSHKMVPSHQTVVMMSKMIKQHQQMLLAKQQAAKQRHEFDQLRDKCRLLEVTSQVQQQRITELEMEAEVASRLTLRTSSSVQEEPKRSFRSTRNRKEEAAVGTRQALISSILDECGQDSRVGDTQKWMLLLLVQLTDQAIFGYRAVLQRVLQKHSNRFAFIDYLVSLLESDGKDGALNTRDVEWVMFVRRIVMSYPSMLSYKQLKVVGGWLVGVVEGQGWEGRIKEILQFAVSLKQLDETVGRCWQGRLSKLVVLSQGRDDLREMIGKVQPQ